MIFWAPEALPTIVPIVRSSAGAGPNALDLENLPAGELRRASDGWHTVVRLRGAEHRLWLREAPVTGVSYAAELPFDADFDVRAHAAHRL